MCFFVFGKSINVGVALFLKGSALFLPFHLPPLFYCATIVTLYHNKVNRQNEVFSKKTENAACLKKYSISKRNRGGYPQQKYRVQSHPSVIVSQCHLQRYGDRKNPPVRK